MKRLQWNSAIAASLCLLLVACAAPPPSDQLLLARSAYKSIANNPDVARSAAQQLTEAQKALEIAENKHQAGDDPAIVNHYAYLAEKHAQTAREQAVQATLRARLVNADETRNEMMLDARTSQARSAEARADDLEQQLEELQAEQTERGMVITLSDVLFDFDQADLKASAMGTVNKLSRFMVDYPKRRVRIEGYTDSTGDDAYNRDLSQRRAQAVKRALTDAGISANRIEIEGYGEDYPVADNATSSGRQQNRRVEVVISDPEGQLKAR